MPEFTVTATTSASPETVWRVLTDLDAYPVVIDAIVRVERVAGGQGFGVGHGTTYRDTVRVSSVFSGSTVTVTSGLHRPGRLARLTAKASAKAFELTTRTLVDRDLADVVAAAEAS